MTVTERTRVLIPPWEYERYLADANSGGAAASAHILRNWVEFALAVHRGGGLVICGTDAPLDAPATATHMNLRAMVKYGFTPREALITATRNPARWLGLPLGAIKPGAPADISFVEGNPLADIKAAANVRQVMVGGRVHRGVHGAAGIVGEMPELRWAELNERYGSSVLASPRPSRQEIFDAARAGDPAAVAAMEEFADDLATGAAAMTLAIDPELLVIGGGSSPGADVFLPRFEESLREWAPGTVRPFDGPDPVRPAAGVLAHGGVAGPVSGESTGAEQLFVLVDDLDGG